MPITAVGMSTIKNGSLVPRNGVIGGGQEDVEVLERLEDGSYVAQHHCVAVEIKCAIERRKPINIGFVIPVLVGCFINKEPLIS